MLRVLSVGSMQNPLLPYLVLELYLQHPIHLQLLLRLQLQVLPSRRY